MQSCAQSVVLDLPDAQPWRYRFASLPVDCLAGGDPHGPWSLAGESGTWPVQTRTLGRTPQGLPRWVFAQFVTPRGGKFTLQPTPAADTLTHPAVARQIDGDVQLSNGLVSVTVGRDGLRVGRGRDPWVQGLDLRVHAGGLACLGRIEALQVTASGPVCAAVEATGRHLGPAGEPGLAFRLRVELFAQLPTLAVRYWFFHLLPGCESLPVESIELTLPLRGATGRRHFMQRQHGLQAVPRAVTTTRALDARVGEDQTTAVRLADPAALHDDTPYPPYLMPPADVVDPWLAVQTEQGWCALAMDDLCELKPKALRADDAGLGVDVWPRWAGVLDLPQGRSRSVTLRLALLEASQDPPRQVAAALEASRCDAPVLLAPAAYADADVFGQARVLRRAEPGARRFDDYLRRVACPPSVCDFMDLGDTIDPGYSRTYLSTGRRLNRIVPPEQARPLVIQTDRYAAQWCDLSQYEKVWTNNEYDIIWCIGGEMLRSGRAELFQSLRWFSRHAIEVDFVHYSDHAVKHRSTPPHCARHTSAGTYPSHLWTEGLLQYHVLSGDDDALDFARAIADKIIELFADADQRAKLWHPTRELGWALVATAAVAEMDPQDRFLKISRELADALIATPIDDAYVRTAVRYSFGFASIVLGLDRWHDVCRERKYADWLVSFARAAGPHMQEDSGVVGPMSLLLLHAGYKHCGDAELIRHGMRTLERLLDSASWYDPPMYTKPLAMLWRPLSRFFADAGACGFLQGLDYRF
jgi:hypothetical protein